MLNLNNSFAFGGLDGLNFYANILQIASYEQLLKQANNDDILKELKHQNGEYLEKILEKQDEILELLKKLEVKNEINKGNINGDC